MLTDNGSNYAESHRGVLFVVVRTMAGDIDGVKFLKTLKMGSFKAISSHFGEK